MTSTSSEDLPKAGSFRVGIHYPMLTRSNYGVWAMKMKVFISVQEAWEAIVPSDPAGVIDAGKNHRALTALYQAVPDDVLLMLGEKSAKEAWETLKIMNLGADRLKEAKLQTLKSNFESLKMRDADSVDDFAMKLTTNVNRQRELGGKLKEEEVVKKFLRAVPSKFIQVASNIEQFGDFKTLTVEEIIARLKTHEERVGGSIENEDEKVLLTQEEWVARSKKNGEGGYEGRGRGYHGRGRGRDGGRGGGRGPAQGEGKDKSNIQCFACQKYGHYASECFSRKREEEANFAEYGPALLMAKGEVDLYSSSVCEEFLADEEKIEYAENQSWYLNTGASNHMTGSRDSFSASGGDKDRELGDAQLEIKALRLSERAREKAVEELTTELTKMAEKLKLTECLLENKNLEVKKISDGKRAAMAAQFAAEATLRRVHAVQKDDNKALDRVTKSKEAALLEAERTVQTHVSRDVIFKEAEKVGKWTPIFHNDCEKWEWTNGLSDSGNFSEGGEIAPGSTTSSTQKVCPAGIAPGAGSDQPAPPGVVHAPGVGHAGVLGIGGFVPHAGGSSASSAPGRCTGGWPPVVQPEPVRAAASIDEAGSGDDSPTAMFRSLQEIYNETHTLEDAGLCMWTAEEPS